MPIQMTAIAAAAPARCVCEYETGCVCLDEERALRWFQSPDAPPMTAEQREECLVEIDRVEGYRRADYATASDAALAQGALAAWLDDARDKGAL